MRSVFASVLAMIAILGSLPAQTVPAGGSIPNPFPFPLNYQIAIPDPSNPVDPWKELATGVAPVGGGAAVPNSPDLCGVEIRVVAWDFSIPPLVLGPYYFTVTCP